MLVPVSTYIDVLPVQLHHRPYQFNLITPVDKAGKNVDLSASSLGEKGSVGDKKEVQLTRPDWGSVSGHFQRAGPAQ